MLSNDIELAGTPYNVIPGSYRKGLRKRLAVSKPAARKIGTVEFGPFQRGVLQSSAHDEERGWSSLTVGPVFDGEGVEPFPNSASFPDAMVEIPSLTNRAYGVVAGNRAFIGIGRRVYKSVLLTDGGWSALTVAADLGAGFTISGLTYFQDDVLIMLATGQDIRKLNTTTDVVSIWRAGEKGKFGVAYAGQLIYAPCAVNNQEELRLSGTKWNGNAVTHFRYLDAPIINMASFNGQVVIATRKSLYFMGGQPYPGEADDAAITGDSSRAPEWRGDPEPLMGHGVFAEGDDFIFLESYRGRLYTWLGGRVAEFDDSTDEANWRRIGPDGAACYGACVAGDWLIVAVQSRYGGYEAWGFNGEGWWLLLQRGAAPAVIWPCPLAGAGSRDALLFRHGGGSYDLLRLRWRSTALNTYASGGEWTSSLIDGGDPTADKAWRRIGSTFAVPGDRGNAASVDGVSFPLEYSIDGGITWTTAADTPAASGASRVLTREVTFEHPPVSRVLQLRQRWISVSDWAPVLTSLWVEYENAEEYALGELARAAYEAELAAEGLLRRRWELTIDAGDRRVRRDGTLDARTGRQAIAALWDAWELGTAVTFKDIDHDTAPVNYLVTIAGMEEKAVKPSDSARWGESVVTLILEEGAPGVVALPPGFDLDALSDVTLGAPVDGHVLVYDGATGHWVNEPAPPSSLDSDLVAIAALSPANDDVIQRKAGAWTNRAPALLKADLALNNVDNTSDANKPVSTATAAALATKSPIGHGHDAADVVSGQFAMARLASGVPDGTKFIRDDGVLATPAGSGGSPLVFVSTAVEQINTSAALYDFAQRYAIPVGNAAVGKVYRLVARGIVNNGSGGARTYTFAVRLGGVTIGTFTAISLPATTANRAWELTADLIVVSTGAGGTAELQGTLIANGNVEQIMNTARVNFDTTAIKTFGAAVTMSVANASVWTEQRQIMVEAL